MFLVKIEIDPIGMEWAPLLTELLIYRAIESTQLDLPLVLQN